MQIKAKPNRAYSAVFQLLSQVKTRDFPTIGLELEFFLRDRSNQKLASLDQTQAFLKTLADAPSWKIFSKNETSQKILRVSKNLPEGRYHTVKYEHPPHMMELALSFSDNLIDLKQELTETLETLRTAAQKTGLILDHSSAIQPPLINWEEVNQIETRFAQLSQSRKKLFQQNNPKEIPNEKIDFSTFLAATQTHLGGIRWWELRPDFIETLYKNEFLISSCSFTSRKNFISRWENYFYVFKQLPLTGFPQLTEWTFESWVDQLLYNQTHIQDSELEKTILSQRDLQIVKPKWIGTLEFRADPATSDIDLIISQAALRLSAYLNAQKPHYQPILHSHSFLSLAQLWNQGLHINQFQKELENLKQEAWSTLKARGKNEEGLL